MATLIENNYKIPLPVTYEFVTEVTPVEWVQQYFLLRQEVYTDYWKLKNFSGGEDHYDRNGYTILVIHNNRCVGGGRLVIRDAYTDSLLPLEEANFLIKDLLPELGLYEKNYGEVCRVAMLPDFRKDGSYTKEMYHRIAILSKQLNLSFLFAVAPIVQSRKIRMATKSFGLSTKILNEIKVPDSQSHENIEMRFVRMNINEWSISENNIQDTSIIDEREFCHV